MNELAQTISNTMKYIETNTIQRNILGGLFAVLIGTLIWINQSRRTASRQAGDRIIEAFQPELDALIQTSGDAGNILTDEVLNKHDSAIRNNLPRLLWIQKFRLRRAWHEMAYCQVDEQHKILFYTMYSDCGSLDIRRKMRPLAIARIQKIISIVT